MTNLVKQNNSLVVTSDNDFPFEEGKITLPFSSVYYVVDESELVVFKSISNGDILFQGKLGEMTIDGEIVTKDNIIAKFDKFNSTSGGGGGITSETDPIWEAEKGDYVKKENIKTINGESILGEGDITIQGGANIKAGDGIYISEDAEGAKVISTKPYSTTANTYVAWYDGNWNVDYFDDGVISPSKYSRKTFTKAEIGNGITKIGGFAFESCRSLTSVTIPDSVTNTSGNAFNDCRSLSSVTIGNGLTKISCSDFQSCSGLTSIEIPSSVTSIEIYAFQYCSKLTSITIPSSVTSIGRDAFYNVPTSGTLYCDDDWFNNLSSTSKANLGNIANWTRKPLPKPIEERVDDLEVAILNVYTKTEIDEKLGDIESLLHNI